jgi:acetyl-CoA C-acetyltransferase
MSEDLTPVLIGLGQVTEKDPDVEAASSPLDLIEQATYLAAEDAGIKRSSLQGLDTLVIVKSFRESTRNSPEVLANRIGASKAAQWIMPDGGNGPQYLVNRYADEIASGSVRFALFAGSEAMATGRKIYKATGEQPAWQEPSASDPTFLVEDMPMSSRHEKAHGIWLATGFYAMSENAQRHHYGKTIAEHQQDLGRLFSKFTDVAALSPHAWYPLARTADEIATASDQNRYVAWPYTKYMTAMNQINQSAALLLTSVSHARSLGVDESKFIYLHGCADTKELGVSERPNYYTSNAIRVMAEQTFADSDLSISDVAHIDFYSCFPSAVEMARDHFGISPDDDRSLTITGGLPFHGGAGNNYVMNSIAAMGDRLREDAGSYGLVTANGGYFSKHAAGIYSTVPTEGQWSRVSPAIYQEEIDNLGKVPFTETPAGEATIETYTVIYGRDNQPDKGYAIGRLGDHEDPGATRFFSVLPEDKELLTSMTREDMIGTKGEVSADNGLNLLRPV